MGQKANTKTAGGQGAAAAAALIAARGLTRSYALGANLVVGVAGIDLAVNAGELVLLKGHSGSGKSTLLSLLAGLDRPTGGELVVAGHDLNRRCSWRCAARGSGRESGS